jgi:hypothetical protein
MNVRISLVFVACVLLCGPGAVAQAISQGVLLNQQSIQNADNAKVPAPRISQPHGSQSNGQEVHQTTPDSAAVQSTFVAPGRSEQPFFSEYAGYVTPGTQLTISGPEPAATIYYTIDGWTPTENSLEYVKPFPIQHDMRVQAFAVEPGMMPSPIIDATFIVKPQQPPVSKTLLIERAILHRGMALRLVTGANASSDSSQVGDAFLVKLDEDIMLGDTILASRGSLGKAKITRVERAGRDGKPGVIAFKVESLDAHGISVPLNANLTLAAPDVAAQAAKIANPSVVRVSGTLPKGDEAVIEPGMPLSAYVMADTPLR